MKKFAVFDFDGTLIRWQLYHSVVDKLNNLGLIHPTDFEKIVNGRMSWKTRKPGNTFKEYEKTLVEVYERTLKNISYDDFLKAGKQVFEEQKEQVYTYTRDLLTELKKENYILLAVSGSQIEIVEMVAQYWGFDDWVGSKFEVVNDKFTGKADQVYGKKKQVLNSLIKKHDLTMKGSIAVGDSESDISMLKMVERPIAFNPTQLLIEHAKKNKWDIIVERKNVVYKLKSLDNKYYLE